MYPTTISTWALLIRKALDSSGIDGQALFKAAGLELDAQQDPDTRFPLQKMQQVWTLIYQETGDECFGLKIAQYWHPSHFHALGYTWLASETLMDAYQRLARYGHLMNDALDITLEEHKGEVLFILGWDKKRIKDYSPSMLAIDTGMATILFMSRFIYGDDFSPLRMMTIRTRPACIDDYNEFFRCGIEFEADSNGYIFSREMLDKRLPTGNRNLVLLHDQVLVDYLSRLDKDDIRMQVQKKLTDNLSAGELSEEKMADALNMSTRSLQRKLQQQGTSYKKLLNQTRHELAQTYVKDKKRSFSEITYLLGFSEQSNFTRAFKRWEGMAPSEYRDAV